MENNPYSSPNSALIDSSNNDKDNVELADRGTRLGAAIVDALIVGFVTIPFSYILGIFHFSETPFESTSDMFLHGLVSIVVYLALNLKLLLSNGQTIAKKMLSIKVVDSRSLEIPSWQNLIVKRWLVFVIIQQIPYTLVAMLGLINALLIFRNSKKCLHDDLANTIVVKC